MRKIVLAIVGAVLAASTLVAVPQTATAALPPVSKKPSSCDKVGDTQKADDCVRQSFWGPSQGNVIKGRTGYVQVQAQSTVRGKATTGQVQFRRITKNRTKSPWIVRSSFKLTGKETAKGALVPIRHCGVKGFPAGKYQVRTVLSLPVGPLRARSVPMADSLSASPTPAPSSPAATPSPTTQPAASTPSTTPTPAPAVIAATQAVSALSTIVITPAPSCASSPEDEASVEYFNQQSFLDTIQLLVTYDAASNSGTVAISCPVPASPSFPPATLEVTIETLDQAQTSKCNSPSTIALTNISSISYCDAQSDCTFIISATNSATQQTYSQTRYEIQMSQASQAPPSVVVPSLEAATLPACGVQDN